MYDIVFSILVHEKPCIVDDLIENIVKYTKEYNIIICLHMNPFMYQHYENKRDYVFINEKIYEKDYIGISISQAHIDNFYYLKKKNIEYRYFMFLASNCMFIRQIDLSLIEKKNEISSIERINFENILMYKKYLKKKYRNWKLIKNVIEQERFMQLFFEFKIYIMIKQIEGQVYTYQDMETILGFVDQHNVLDLVNKEIPFVLEEVLFSSLSYHLLEKNAPTTCYIPWHRPKTYIPKRNEMKKILKDSNIFSVKRVPREMDDPLRQFIRQLS